VSERAAALPAEPRPWGRALAWLAFLGPFFFLSYGFATWFTAQRAHVPAIVFDWERAIPFWPWTIVPYWIIDLLYGVSLLVCTSRRELDTHAKRLLTAQLVAVAIFVAAPLRFSFTPPAAEGVAGLLFAALAQFDRPFNQLPSLHIALAAILWALYARKLDGPARRAMEAGFVLIGASVLTTWQHHFIDVPTGWLLGMLCVWAWPQADEGDGRSIASQWSVTRDAVRLRLAARYALGALWCAALALALGGWALWLLWPAVSLALVALAYAALGPGAFQKRADGRLSAAARWLFAPYLAGAWINSRAWTFGKGAPREVADGVHLGRVPTARELAASPFAALVDLTAEFDVRAGMRAYATVPMLDLVPPDPDDLARAAREIQRLRVRGPVLVCCALGRSRSACAVAAWLIATGRATDGAAAVRALRAARAPVALGDAHLSALAGIAGAPSVAD
jgi:protein-tyrosine phosphatase